MTNNSNILSKFFLGHNAKSKMKSIDAIRAIKSIISFCRTSMEDSSHSTPSPMSSAASSQDSLHRRIHLGNAAENPYGTNPYQHLMVGGHPHMSAAQAAAAKKKGMT